MRYGETTPTASSRAAPARVVPRDIGAAVGRNPLCIIIRCHRVVGAAGKLTGHAAGLDRKRPLLEID